MNDQLVITRPDAGLICLTISGRGRSNAVDARLASELSRACAEINLDTEVRAVIISGPEGRWFCTAPAAGKKTTSSLAAPVGGLCCPVIAALDGNIYGQALELALACDIRVASRTARFAFPGIERGLSPRTALHRDYHASWERPRLWSYC